MLICGNLQENVKKCEGVTWMFSDSRKGESELIKLGNVTKKQNSRFSLSENCSLLIPEVQAEHVGGYYCQQSGSGVEQQLDATVYLSVVTCEYTHSFFWFFEVQNMSGLESVPVAFACL